MTPHQWLAKVEGGSLACSASSLSFASLADKNLDENHFIIFEKKGRRDNSLKNY